MHLSLVTVSLLVLASGVASQCTGNDDPACSSWKKNGFCTNTGYSMDMRKLYCGVSCGFCNKDGTQTAAGGGPVVSCADNNANCASWAANGFCTDPSNSEAMKKQYCCKTCSAPVIPPNPTTNCAVIYNASTETNTDPTSSGTMPIVLGYPLTKVFVKIGHSLTLLVGQYPFSPSPESPIVGADQFMTLSGTATTATGYTCT